MSAPVKHTCPDIDSIIKRIKAALKYSKDGLSITDKGTEEHSTFDYIETELWGIEGDMEQLRSANASLRDWGEDLEKQVKELEDQVYFLEQKIEEQTQCIHDNP